MYWSSSFQPTAKIEKVANTYEEKTYPSRFVDDPRIKKRLETIEATDWPQKSLGLCIMDKDVCLYQLKFTMNDGIKMNASRLPRPTKIIPQINDHFEVHYPDNTVRYYQIVPLRVCVYDITM